MLEDIVVVEGVALTKSVLHLRISLYFTSITAKLGEAEIPYFTFLNRSRLNPVKPGLDW